jgi:predicted TIM-barrel fold metal-dependent hydrolase
MRIGELSQKTGASVRSLRHYEAAGLIQAARASNSYREFGIESIVRVRQIQRLLLNGCTLEEVALLLPCYESPAHERLPLWVHTFGPLQAADLRHLAALADRFPRVPLILGHLGGVNWLEAIELARPRPQLYLDLSAVFSPLAPQMATQALPERCLFSSDAPYGDPLLARQLIERVVPSPEVRAKVLGGNVAELLRL